MLQHHCNRPWQGQQASVSCPLNLSSDTWILRQLTLCSLLSASCTLSRAYLVLGRVGRSYAYLTQMVPGPAEKVQKLLHLDTETQEQILRHLLVSVPGLESALQGCLDTAGISDSSCSTPLSTSSSDTTDRTPKYGLLGSPFSRQRLTGSRIPTSPSRPRQDRKPLSTLRAVQPSPSGSQPGLSDSSVAYFWTLLLSFRKALQGRTSHESETGHTCTAHILTGSPSADRQPGADMVWTKCTPRGPGEQQMLCQLCSEQKFLKGQEGYQLQPYLDGVTPHVSSASASQ